MVVFACSLQMKIKQTILDLDPKPLKLGSFWLAQFVLGNLFFWLRGEVKCGPLSGLGTWLLGLNIVYQDMVLYLKRFQSACGLPRCCRNTLLIKGYVSECLLMSRDRTGLSWLPGGTVVFRVSIYSDDWIAFLFCGHGCYPVFLWYAGVIKTQFLYFATNAKHSFINFTEHAHLLLHLNMSSGCCTWLRATHTGAIIVSFPWISLRGLPKWSFEDK